MSQKESSKQTQTTSYTPFQTDVLKDLKMAYSPYVGAGTLGGLSDLETNALNMLRSADVWSPLTTAGTGLLTGSFGPKTITPEESTALYQGNVVAPAEYQWSKYGGARDTLANELAGPSYLSRGKNIIADKYGEMQNALAAGKGGWEANIANINRAIEEAKAGRALSALGAVPSSLLGWTGGLAGMGRRFQTIMNQITDPQVLNVLQTILSARPMGTTYGETTSTPSTFQQVSNWADLLGKGAQLASGLPPMSFGGSSHDPAVARALDYASFGQYPTPFGY